MNENTIERFNLLFADAEKNLRTAKTSRTKPWENMYRIVYNKFQYIHGKSSENTASSSENIEKNVNRMYRWYSNQYHTASSYESKSRTTSTKSMLKTGTGFDHWYNFDKPYTKTMFTCYLSGKPTPKRNTENNAKAGDKPPVVFIIHLAVAFKLTAEECDDILQAYGYFKLHSKNIFHLAVYCVLKDIEKNPSVFQTDFGQFQRLRDLYQSAIVALQNESTQSAKYLPKEPVVFSGDREFGSGSTTQLMEFVDERITGLFYVDFIRRHRDEFNERHSKVREEYFRLLDIIIAFFDGDRTVKRSERSFHEFILEYCQNLERKHFRRDLIQKITEEDREPTREILIILWTWEYCFKVAGNLTLPLADGMDFLRKVHGISTNEKLFVEKVFSYSPDCPGFWEQIEAVKEWKTARTPVLEPHEKEAIEDFFDVYFSGNDVVINMSTLLKTKYILKTSNFSWGGSYMRYINSKLDMFGLSILSAANAFDLCFMMLRYINCRENTDGSTTWFYQSATAHTDLLHFGAANHCGYPDGLRFLFHYLSAYKAFKKAEYPLECDIYKKL